MICLVGDMKCCENNKTHFPFLWLAPSAPSILVTSLNLVYKQSCFYAASDAFVAALQLEIWRTITAQPNECRLYLTLAGYMTHGKWGFRDFTRALALSRGK